MVRKESAVILEVVYNMPPPLPPRLHGAVSVGGVWFPLFGLWGVFSAAVPAVSSVVAVRAVRQSEFLGSCLV